MSSKQVAPSPGESAEVEGPSPDSLTIVDTTCNNSMLIDLYAIEGDDKMWKTLTQKEAPFIHWLLLHGPQGEIIRVKALFDRGAMVGAMCTSFFNKVQHRLLGQTKASNRHLCVANGVIVPSQAVWSGVMELGGLRAEGEFEVFDSGGGWEFLFGKLLLHRFKALHNFDTDTVTIRLVNKSITLCNDVGKCAPTALTGISLMLDMEQWGNSVGHSLGTKPPSRQVSHTDILDSKVQNDKPGFISDCTNDLSVVVDEYLMEEEECLMEVSEDDIMKDTVQEDYGEVKTMQKDLQEQGEEQNMNQGGSSEPPLREVHNQYPTVAETKEADNFCITVSRHPGNAVGDPEQTMHAPASQTELLQVEQGDLSGGSAEPPLRGVPTYLADHMTTPADTPCLMLPVTHAADTSPEDAIFTCHTEPFLPACIEKIMELVRIGKDITTAQREEVKLLIAEFANCFALLLSEVNLIPGAVHKLNISEDATFCTKIPQHSFNPDQRAFMNAKVDEMLKGGIIHPIHPGEVECIAQYWPRKHMRTQAYHWMSSSTK